MCKSVIYRLFLFLVVLCQIGLFSQEGTFEEEWKKEDPVLFLRLQTEMAPLLEQHVSQKTLDEAFIQKAAARFLDLLDPAKAYFLTSEVAPFFSAKNVFYVSFEKGSLGPFWELFLLKIKAVERAQAMRKALFPFMLTHKKELAALEPLTMKEFAQDDDDLILHQITYWMACAATLPTKEKTYNWKEHLARAESKIMTDEDAWLSFKGKFTKEALFFYELLSKAFSQALDSHSNLLNSKEADSLRKALTKMAYGTGIQVQMTGSSVQIAKIAKGSPAASMPEVQVGDTLVTINGKATKKMTEEEIQESMETGAENETVEVTIRTARKPKRTFSLSILKKKYIDQEGRLQWQLIPTDEGDVLSIALDSFYKGQDMSSEADFRKAWKEANAIRPVRGVLLDVRKNRGGFLLEAVKIAGLFIKSGVIVVVEYSDGSKRYFRDLDPEMVIDCPTVVLMSNNTASAAEVLVQAVHDYGVGILVGDEQTYGKGSVQMQTVAGGDSQTDSTGQYKVTVGELYGVSGKTPQAKGVPADIVVPSFYGLSSGGEDASDTNLSSQDKKENFFNDSLDDVSGIALGWYRKYYIPFLQKPQKEWEGALPLLKQKSLDRRMHNQFWRAVGRGETKDLVRFVPKGKSLSSLFENEQKVEAFSILKDMMRMKEEPASKEAAP